MPCAIVLPHVATTLGRYLMTLRKKDGTPFRYLLEQRLGQLDHAQCSSTHSSLASSDSCPNLAIPEVIQVSIAIHLIQPPRKKGPYRSRGPFYQIGCIRDTRTVLESHSLADKSKGN